MRNRFTVTITDITGSTHYEVKKVYPWVLGYTLLTVFVTLVVSFMVISGLHKDMGALATEKDAISRKLLSLSETNGSLISDIQSKQEQFTDMDMRIGMLEELMGMENDPNKSLAERMEQAGMEIARREQEFKEIGDKVEDIEGLIGVEKIQTADLSRRVDLVTLTAAQKAAMLESIPNGFPIVDKGINSGFGGRQHPVLHRKSFHTGTDLKAEMSTLVHATADGVVEASGYHKISGMGNLVIIRHNYGFRTTYAHLEEALVQPGDFVKKGDLIAKSGNTGLSSGPHLHYEVSFIQHTLDPVPFLQWRLDNYEAIFEEKSVQWGSLVSLINLRLTKPTPPSLQVAQKSEERSSSSANSM